MSSPIAALTDREFRGVLEIGCDRDGGSWVTDLVAERVTRVDDVDEVGAPMDGHDEPLDLVVDHTADAARARLDLSVLLGRVDVGGTYVVATALPLAQVLDLVFIAVERPDVIAAVEVDAGGNTTLTCGTLPPSLEPTNLDELGADPFGVNVFGVGEC